MKSLLFGASTLLSLSAMTQEPSALLEALTDQSIEARPGRMMTATGEVLAHWVTTTSETPLAKGSWSLSAASRDRARMAIAMPGLAEFEYGRNGATAWMDDPVTGPTVLDESEGKGVQRLLALFSGDWNWRNHYQTATFSPQVNVNDEGSVLLAFRMLPSEGEQDLWYLDQATGHLHGVDLHIDNRLGETLLYQLRLTDWQERSGGMYPESWSLTQAHHRFAIQVESMDWNTDLNEAIFQPGEDLEKAARLWADSGTEPAHELVRLQESYVASIRRKVDVQNIGMALGEILSQVMTCVTSEGIQITSAPFARYHSISATAVDMEAGVSVTRPIEGNERVRPGTLPGGRVLSAWHVGPYDTLTRTHQRLEAWMSQQGLESAGASWELYWTDPGMEPDPAKWRTQIFMPVR